MNAFKRNINWYYPPILILVMLIASFFRFHNLSNLMVFSADEEYQVNLAMSIVKDFHVIWIGVSASNLGFYLGPLWIYFTALWLFFSKGDPLILGYVTASIGVLTTALIFILGKNMFNFKVGLVASFLYSFLPIIVLFDQKYYPSAAVAMFSLVMMWLLYKLKDSEKFLIFFAVCYALVFHLHLSLIFFGPLAIVWIAVIKPNLTKKVLILSIFSFLVVSSPLIVFDYFHNWSNITTPLRINQISARKTSQLNPDFHAQALFSYLGRIWYLNPNTDNADEVQFSCTSTSTFQSSNIIDNISKRTKPYLIFSVFSVFLLALFVINKKTWLTSSRKIIMLAALSILIPFLLFPGSAFEYYLIGFYPLFVFIPAILIDEFSEILKTISLFGLLILFVINVNFILSLKSSFGLETKKC